MFYVLDSDAIRMILLHRFEGWYSDMDFVFLRPFEGVRGHKNLRNVLVKENNDLSINSSLVFNYGNTITNELFHAEPGHILLKTAINVFKCTVLNGDYTVSGPLVFTKAWQEICGKGNTAKSPFESIDYDGLKCSDIEIVSTRFFYPLDSINARVIQSFDFWNELFKNSVAVHFSKGFTDHEPLTEAMKDKVNSRNKNVLRPIDYGKNKPAITFIGSLECPLSFPSTRPF